MLACGRVLIRSKDVMPQGEQLQALVLPAWGVRGLRYWKLWQDQGSAIVPWDCGAISQATPRPDPAGKLATDIYLLVQQVSGI